MKICLKCHRLFQEQTMSCQQCRGLLEEVTLAEALKHTNQGAFQKHISGQEDHDLADPYKQYHIRSYLQNRSLFLEFDLYKNRLKHGSHLKRFFIAPVNISSVINLPWFLFNLIASNLFHMQYTRFCSRCHSKFIPGQHTLEECEYNIEYFHIIDDILNGQIVDRKEIYLLHARETMARGFPSAYQDLFCRPVRWEGFFDLLSVGLTVLFWLYIAVFVSYPMFNVLIQQVEHIDAYELCLPG